MDAVIGAVACCWWRSGAAAASGWMCRRWSKFGPVLRPLAGGAVLRVVAWALSERQCLVRLASSAEEPVQMLRSLSVGMLLGSPGVVA